MVGCLYPNKRYGVLSQQQEWRLRAEEAETFSEIAVLIREFNDSIVTVTKWDDFVPALDAKKMILAPWCEEVAVEEDVKTRSASEEGAGAKTLCIPFDQPDLPAGTKCFASGKPAKSWALWGRSY